VKILHLVYECVPGAFRGGVQKMVLELACAQQAMGNRVEIWTIGEEAGISDHEGVTLRYFSGRIRFSSAAMQRELREKRGQFDIIHSHNTFLPLNRYAAEAARKGSRVFFNPHGALDDRLLKGYSLRAIKKRIYNRLFERPNLNVAAGVIGLTAQECDQLRLFGVRVPIHEVSNGISMHDAPVSESEQKAFRRRIGTSMDAPILLFIGRITGKKGLQFAIEALAHLRDRHPTAVLAIAGDRKADPAYVAALDQLVAKYALGDRVRWVGFLDEKAKPAALATAAAFVHCSYSEGMAMAILEAMAIGTPCVVTPGCYMHKAAEAGALLEVEQSGTAIADGLDMLLKETEKAKQIGQSGRAYIKAHHDWTAIATTMIGIYEGKG